MLMESASASTKDSSNISVQSGVERGTGRMLLLFYSRQDHSSGPYRPRVAGAGNSTTTQRSFNLTLAPSELLFGQQSSVRNLLIFGYRKSIPSSRELVQTSSMCVCSGDFRIAHPYLEAHIDGRSAAKASRAGIVSMIESTPWRKPDHSVWLLKR